MVSQHRQAMTAVGAACALVLLAAAVVVNTPGRTALLQPQGQKLVAGFSQPGYNPKQPKGLWGKGVPPEFVDDDYKLIKSLADVEQDLDADTALMSQVQAGLGIRSAPARRMRTARGQQLAVGGVDIEGGQGESDSLFGSHDDHSTYGVAGSGWQGAGNGEMPGELWNPAVGRRGVRGSQQLRQFTRPFGVRQQSLAGSVPYPVRAGSGFGGFSLERDAAY